ncbi:MAG: insulinase family protein [Tannerella sp.]|jgi:predicted Zn-dependent peptidase|nr:insulinase family protein [Tannerella sp.]
MKRIKFFTVLLFLAISLPGIGQGLKSFTLRNGMQIYIWEDESQTDVYGSVCVRTGSANDPSEYTGLAHYLEHVMFKGTDKIGSLDWNVEEPLYREIIAGYDRMAEETDPAKKAAIGKEINDLTVKQSQTSLSTEYSNLLEAIGAKGSNAGTSYDYTLYYNFFPAYQINKWLEISSERFINPVFRAFQPELETVYEEYNLSRDNPMRAQSEFVLSKAFEGHPYARSVIGLGEHLKNPRLGKLIQFYEDWYVPGNMALVLVGNIKAEEISGRISATFGRLAAKDTPERKTYPDLDISGRKQYTKKVGDYPSVALVYKGVKAGHPDEIPLEIALSLISNGSSTGILDKSLVEGDLLSAGASPLAFREQGRSLISVVPSFDANQRRFESSRSAERKILNAVEKVAKGDIEDWLIESIKLNMCRDYDLMMESNAGKAEAIMNAFFCNMDMNRVLNYKEEVAAVTIDRVKDVARQYLGNNYLALYMEKGKPAKGEKIKKPGYRPIDKPEGRESLYATQLKSMPVKKVEGRILDFDEVQAKRINDRSTLFYTQNPENNVYSLTIRYGVGERKFPKLGVATMLMNSAGIMGSMKPYELKEAYSKLNTLCRISSDDNYMYVSMYGYEETLPEACQLLMRQILMPDLDDKQLDQIKSALIIGRMNQRDNVQNLSAALSEYITYGDKSSYIDDLTDQEIINLQIAELTGDINRAANYEAEIFYTGTLSFDDAYAVLSQNLPLVAQEIPSDSPKDREVANVNENVVYFLPNSDAEQAHIYFYAPAAGYDRKDDVLYDAFLQYFSGSFNGLVISEIREKRSMAYHAAGRFITPLLPGSRSYFRGELTTQNDKAVEALNVFVDLVRNMPENGDRINNIKSFLREYYQTTSPSFRNKAMYIERVKRAGYTADPSTENVPETETLTFDDIVKFYAENLKGKPLVIGIMGDPKFIPNDELKKFGKVVRINDKKLFNDKDRLF